MSRDSSNDFFSSFENPTAATSRPNGGAAAPPPPRAAAPSAPSYYGNSTTTSQQSAIRPPSKPSRPRPPPGKRPSGATSSSTSYYGNNAAAAGRPAPPAGYSNYNGSSTASGPAASSMNQQTMAPSYYGGGTAATSFPQQQSQNLTTASTTPSASTHSDWYTGPTAGNQHTAMAPQPMNPYATNSQLMESSSSLEGAMDSSYGKASTGGGSSMQPSASLFTPTAMSSLFSSSNNNNNESSGPPSKYGYDDDLANEPPLLEELGINIEHILLKTKTVVLPFRRFTGGHAVLDPAVIVEDADLVGPLVLALLLGVELLLTVKLSFGYIYGFGLFGCLAMTLVLNLMSPHQAVSFWTVTSILGYALLPVNVLAAVKIVLSNLAGQETLTRLLACLTVVWSTTASTRLLEVGCGMANQRYLLAYPIALLYSAFVLITIF